MSKFIDRTYEMADLAEAWEQDGAQLRLLYGRRRVGKTYLLQHFLSETRPHCYFLASAMTIGSNLERLAQALIDSYPQGKDMTPASIPTLWSILQLYGEIAREQRFALVLDEFQYLVEADPSIPSQIQAWWDMAGLRSQAYVFVCGSHVGMMEALAGASQPLYGRFTSRCKLQPMAYYDTALFYEDSDWSVRDKLTAYGVLGGTPKYHAVFSSKEDFSSNIVRHVLSPDGLLRNEPEVVISSSTIRDPLLYNSMLQAVATGETRRSEIEQKAGITSSQFGFCSQTLMDLEWMGREKPFGEDSAKRSIYTIADHFIHFWYRFVALLAGELEFRDTEEVYKSRVEPYINDYMGRYVFEDICMQYLKKNAAIRHDLQIRNAGRYWSRDGKVEIDIVGDLVDGTTLACECKWSSSPVGVAIYYDLMRKVSLLQPPRDTSIVRYAFFSLAGFDENMVDTSARDDIVLITGEDLLD
ncbi:MAG: ATP-binding protein [Armatimonadota bacterium]